MIEHAPWKIDDHSHTFLVPMLVAIYTANKGHHKMPLCAERSQILKWVGQSASLICLGSTRTVAVSSYMQLRWQNTEGVCVQLV